MKALEKLRQNQTRNNSMLCLGLDIDPKKVPSALSGSARGLFEFTRNIIEATSEDSCSLLIDDLLRPCYTVFAQGINKNRSSVFAICASNWREIF